MHEIMTEQGTVREVDVQRILRLLWKRVWVIVAATLVAAILTATYSMVFITPTYRSSFSAYINNKQLSDETISTSSSDLSASRGLMYVYKEVVESRTVLSQAAMESGFYDMGYTLVASMVKAEVTDNAPILRVYVETEDPEMSQRLADAIAKVAPEQVAKVVAGSTMTLIDEPNTPKTPYAPNVTRNTLYGAVLGLVLSVVALIATDLIYDKVLEEDDFEGRYHLPVVGRIPDLQHAQKNDARYAVAKERGGKR